MLYVRNVHTIQIFTTAKHNNLHMPVDILPPNRSTVSVMAKNLCYWGVLLHFELKVNMLYHVLLYTHSTMIFDPCRLVGAPPSFSHGWHGGPYSSARGSLLLSRVLDVRQLAPQLGWYGGPYSSARRSLLLSMGVPTPQPSPGSEAACSSAGRPCLDEPWRTSSLFSPG